MNIRAKILSGVAAAQDSLLKTKKPTGAKADALNSISVARATSRQSNDRGEDRHRLADEEAIVRHNGSDVSVELINLSGGGAMVRGSLAPKLWDHLFLCLGDHGIIECAVRWLRDDQFGLEFAHETRLDWPTNEVAVVLRDVIERSFPDISFGPGAEEFPAPVEPPTGSEHRAAPRHPLIWNGTLHHDFQSDEVRIRNISSTGAMVEVASAVRVGSEPLLDIGKEASIAATVEWAVGDQLGLKFHVPFALESLLNAKPKLASEGWTAPSFMKTKQEDHWDRLSLTQLRDELEGFLKR